MVFFLLYILIYLQDQASPKTATQVKSGQKLHKNNNFFFTFTKIFIIVVISNTLCIIGIFISFWKNILLVPSILFPFSVINFQNILLVPVKALQNWKLSVKALTKWLWKLTIKTKRLWRLKLLSFVNVDD